MLIEIDDMLNKITEDKWITYEMETIKDVMSNTEEGQGKCYGWIGSEVCHYMNHFWDVVGAMKVLKTTDIFWKDPVVFEKTILAINDIEPVFDRVQEYPVSFLVYAIREVERWLGSSKDFSPEVLRYIAARFVAEGIYFNPWLRPVNQYIKEFVRNMGRVARTMDVLERYYDTKDITVLTFNENIQMGRLDKINAYLMNEKGA